MVVLGAVRRAILRRTTGGSVNADPGLGDGEERGRGWGVSAVAAAAQGGRSGGADGRSVCYTGRDAHGWCCFAVF